MHADQNHPNLLFEEAVWSGGGQRSRDAAGAELVAVLCLFFFTFFFFFSIGSFGVGFRCAWNKKNKRRRTYQSFFFSPFFFERKKISFCFLGFSDSHAALVSSFVSFFGSCSFSLCCKWETKQSVNVFQGAKTEWFWTWMHQVLMTNKNRTPP